MLFDLGFTQAALDEFKHLQDKIIKNFDPYIVLSVAGIYYEWSTRCRLSNPDE